MSTIAEIENAVATLSTAEKFELFRFLAGQLHSGPGDRSMTKAHGILDIAPVQLVPLSETWSESDDRLQEMLEGRS